MLVAAGATGFGARVMALLDDDALWCTVAGAAAIGARYGSDVARAWLTCSRSTAWKVVSTASRFDPNTATRIARLYGDWPWR